MRAIFLNKIFYVEYLLVKFRNINTKKVGIILNYCYGNPIFKIRLCSSN